jgi:hypothetical protein
MLQSEGSNRKESGLSSPLTKMSRPRREPENKSLRAAAKSPPTTLGRLSLPPRLAMSKGIQSQEKAGLLMEGCVRRTSEVDFKV